MRIRELFFELIQVALGRRERLSREPSAEEWAEIYAISKKQAVVGVAFFALEQLNKEGQKPPVELLYEWIASSERIKQQNMLMNSEAARLTQLFENEGHRTVILKGQANARLYDDRRLMADGRCSLGRLRQPGDIDIWVSGGKEKVVQTLQKLHLIDGKLEKYATNEAATETYHHIHLPENENGIAVEVHFRPSSGNANPFTNRRLQAFLMQELDRENEMVEEGFRVPSLRFALVMQLAHIQRHFQEGGVGLRQIVDYYYLLMSDVRGKKEGINLQTSDLRLQTLGLAKIAGAVMWVISMMLDGKGKMEEWMICEPDEKRGRMLLECIKEGGNFGHYSQHSQTPFSVVGTLKYRLNRLRLLRFDARETVWSEIGYFGSFLRSTPERIRRRTWTLR